MIAAQSICRPLQAHAAPRRRMVGNFVALFKEWQRRAHGRAELAALSDRELRDIGVTRFDAGREIGKPFWRA
jgi:uncharacterized protein YjiS (DUF1127 family)